jgi:hypothetical protein
MMRVSCHTTSAHHDGTLNCLMVEGKRACVKASRVFWLATTQCSSYNRYVCICLVLSQPSRHDTRRRFTHARYPMVSLIVYIKAESSSRGRLVDAFEGARTSGISFTYAHTGAGYIGSLKHMVGYQRCTAC